MRLDIEKSDIKNCFSSSRDGGCGELDFIVFVYLAIFKQQGFRLVYNSLKICSIEDFVKDFEDLGTGDDNHMAKAVRLIAAEKKNLLFILG